MSNTQIESYIEKKDKSGLYRSYMEKKINDDELLDAIIRIDNSVKPNKTNWLEFIHNILFPSAAH
jgi:hypothetical protein